MELTAKDIITISISVASLALSGFAVWLVQFQLRPIENDAAHPVLPQAC